MNKCEQQIINAQRNRANNAEKVKTDMLKKIDNGRKQFEEMKHVSLVSDLQVFVRGVRSLILKLTTSTEKSHLISNQDKANIEDILAQIGDLSRLILIEELPKKPVVKEPKKEEKKEEVKASVPAPPPLMNLTESPDSSGGQLLTTPCSTQLSIILAQKHVFDPELLKK